MELHDLEKTGMDRLQDLLEQSRVVYQSLILTEVPGVNKPSLEIRRLNKKWLEILDSTTRILQQELELREEEE